MINKKTVLVTIIILLCLFAPLTIVSYFLKEDKNPFDENPHHDFFYKNKLWFYEDDKLISAYECTTDTCDYAKSTINDDTYGINSYKEGSLEKIGLINNNYAFLKDGALVKLYSVKEGSILQNYKLVNTYNTHIADDAYILENENGLWGVVGLNENIVSILPFEYSYIALKDNVLEGTLNSNVFIVLKDDKWYLVDRDNASLTALYNEPIIDYNNDYVITKKDDHLRVYNYEGKEYLNTDVIKDYVLVDNYIGIISQNIFYLYNNLEFNYLKSLMVSEDDDISMEVNNREIIIKSHGNKLDTLALTE